MAGGRLEDGATRQVVRDAADAVRDDDRRGAAMTVEQEEDHGQRFTAIDSICVWLLVRW